ncbi:predicted protein [Chaetomium globosum CBS 148.51]|uniref:Uncharacterized protein n=1 Tax=Chaetomium globosum (strain ATCC 6205 / CBS 148.51 / DSM 1962 / NBRC 6347 / NRRL 1970) TaxID=306901 RepID=Q2GRN2_CHAGB|nr:uncharacterized protein CHGG_09372 [Chaetomium globosum CBS 148.51]EAQ85358.1 predicted protein [Chaetomium globosum CBS 148.51]
MDLGRVNFILPKTKAKLPARYRTVDLRPPVWPPPSLRKIAGKVVGCWKARDGPDRMGHRYGSLHVAFVFWQVVAPGFAGIARTVLNPWDACKRRAPKCLFARLLVALFACMLGGWLGGTAGIPPASNTTSPTYRPTMAAPISVEAGSMSLPIKDGPIHIHASIPFSLLVKDFDPNTAQVPQTERPRPWWSPARLFKGQHEIPTDAAADAATKTFALARPAFSDQVWPRLSTLLFGKEEPTLYCSVGSDAEDWEGADTSNSIWVFSTGVTEDDIDRTRALLLKANPDGTGGILFTAEELGEEQKAAWKTAWVDVAPYKSPGESDIDCAMTRKNQALYRYMSGCASRHSNEKGSFDSHRD